jgi:hypothetical protein
MDVRVLFARSGTGIERRLDLMFAGCNTQDLMVAVIALIRMLSGTSLHPTWIRNRESMFLTSVCETLDEHSRPDSLFDLAPVKLV